MDAFRIAALGITATVCVVLIKPKEATYGAVISIISGIFIFICIVGRMSILIGHMRELVAVIEDGDTYLNILLKASGITVVSEFAAGICKDNQMNSVADMIRIFAKISLFLISLPVLTTVIGMIRNFSF